MEPTNLVFQPDNVAVITGAASGIGLALARKCSGYGMRVILVDNHGPNLAIAQASLGVKTEAVEMDVTQPAAFALLKEKINAEYGGRVALLALNAGIAPNSHWADVSYFRRVFDVNFFGVTHGLNYLLSLVTSQSCEEQPAAIIITGSKQGITNPPGNPAYNASKAAVKAIAENLAFDLLELSPTTSVHLLVPGWTYTGMTQSSGSTAKKEKPDGAWTPEQVIEFLEQKMLQKKFYIICPDNDVSEDLDKVRITWAADDLIHERPPLTRWRAEWKGEFEEWIKNSPLHKNPEEKT